MNKSLDVGHGRLWGMDTKKGRVPISLPATKAKVLSYLEFIAGECAERHACCRVGKKEEQDNTLRTP